MADTPRAKDDERRRRAQGMPARASVSRSVASGQFTYDYPAWAPTSSVTIEMAGKTRTVSCVIPAAVLAQLR